MSKSRETDTTGDLGEHLAAVVLAPIATVERRGEGIELDLYCELRRHPGCAFHVQAKGSTTPHYGKGTISSLPVKRRTIEDYWLRQPYPVFLVMSDTRRLTTYCTRVSENVYSKGESETYTFRIPLTNELTPESAGVLIPEILKHQPNLSAEGAGRLADDFRDQHPLLCHDLSQLDSLLEIMRGCDQHAQVTARLAIQTLVESGKLNSHRLESGLLAIFQNCKDRITQSHVLDAILAIKSQRAAGEVIKQIDRNTRLLEYENDGPGFRHRYIDFLFRGLARLGPPYLATEIRRLLIHPEPPVVKGAVWLIGELELPGFVDDLVHLLGHGDSGVRDQSVNVLRAVGQKNCIRRIRELFETAHQTNEIVAAIRVMEQFGDFDKLGVVADLNKHPAAEVRAAVASYLGASQSPEYFDRLLDLSLDDDRVVWGAASRSGKLLDSVPASTKEERIIQRLVVASGSDDELRTSVLFGLLASCASDASRPVLVDIFRQTYGKPKRYLTVNACGEPEVMTTVDLKTQALQILRRFDIVELYDEIIEGLASCDLDAFPLYMEVAAEKRIYGAFDALASLPTERLEFWGGFVLQAMANLDPERAVRWAMDVTLVTSSPVLMTRCCEFLKARGVDPCAVEGCVGQIRTLFSELPNRCEPCGLYELVRQCRIEDVVSTIVGDLALLRSPEWHDLNMPVLEMFQTLAALDDTRGHQALIRLLPECPPHLRRAILEDLAKHQPKVALPELQRFRSDPELSVRETCEGWIERLCSSTE